MHDSKPVASPMSSTTPLSQFSSDLFFDPTLYRSIVGSLQYLSLIRLDLAFLVKNVCQFLDLPTNNHWSAVKHMLCYLKNTLHHGLLHQKIFSFDIHTFSNVDWASSPNDRCSTSGYCIFFDKNLISWRSWKQRFVSRSSTKSEDKAISHTTI